MNPSLLPLAVLALAAGPWLAPDVETDAAPSAPVDYAFRDAPLNSMGVKSLAELRGKPVLIEFWGKN